MLNEARLAAILRIIMERGIQAIWRFPCDECNIRQGICNADVVFHNRRIRMAVRHYVRDRWADWR